MSQDVISTASIYREHGIFAPLSKLMSYLLCLTPPFGLWSQVLGLVCMWPGGSQGKIKDKCWSGDCTFRASGWSKWGTETRPLPQLLPSSNPDCTSCLETVSWQLHYNYELSLCLGWNWLPKAWGIKGASQMQTSGAWESSDTRCLWAVCPSFL